MATVVEKAARIRIAAAVLVACMSTACSSEVLDEQSGVSTVVVGSGETAEEETLAHVYAGLLRTTGVDVQLRTGLPDPFGALDGADVTIVPGFSGRVLAHYDPGAEATRAEDVFEVLARALPDELTVSDYASAQDRAVLIAPDGLTAAEVADLVPRCNTLTLVHTDRFESAGGIDALADAGCEPAEFRRVGSDSIADAAGPDTVIGVTSTSPTLVGQDLGNALRVVADAPDPGARADGDEPTDPPVFPAQNLVPIFRKGGLDDPQLDALRIIAGEMTTGDLTDFRVRLEAGDRPVEVAGHWLAEHT